MALARLLFGLLCLYSFNSAVAFTVSSDQQYYVYDDNSYRFIYSDEYRPFIKALAARNATIKAFYEKDFLWKLDEKPYLILASPRNQIANGFATTLPTLHTVFYGGGAESVDEFSATSWLNTLLSHETSHLYQTDVKQSYSSLLHSIFGNPTPSPAPPFTYMMSPNIFLPTFILEGNATYNEGRFGNGGRLYDGENRALFLSLLKAGKVNSKRLMNDHIDWPYGREKYVVGAYVQEYLGQKYGVEKVNAFFLRNAGHFVNPFLLNTSFIESFGAGYEQVLRDLNAQYRPYAAIMKTTPVTISPLAKSISNGGFTRAGSTVYFMTSDGYKMPYLYEVTSNGTNVLIKKKRRNLPMGKPLLWNDKIYVASGEQFEATAIRFSLFTDNYSRLEEFDNKFVYDTKEHSSLYADVPHSFEKMQLYKNGQYIGEAQSAAKFDEDGHVLYFKQVGDQRTLYRDSEALITYKGYYGTIASASKNGDVYIIGATEKGSSLFRVRNRTISRVLAADSVVDAELLDDKQAVVAEITDNGYRYKVVPLEEETSESPYYYEYFYDKDASMKILAMTDDSATPNQVTDKPVDKPANEDRYSTLRYTQFDGVDPFVAGVTAAGDVIAGVTARFSDPMEFHTLSFAYAHMEGDTNDATLLYTNRVYRLNWTLGAMFDQSAILANEGQDDEKVLGRYNTWDGVFQLNYPLFTHPQNSGEITTRYTYEYDESEDKTISLDREQSVLTYIDLNRSRSYSLAYEANLHDRLVLAHEAVGDIPKWAGDRNHYAALASFSRDLWSQDYFTVGYHVVRSDAIKPDIEINKASLTGVSVGLENPAELTRYSTESDIEYREAHQLTLGYKKGIDAKWYFTKFPISLRRFAPFATYNEYKGRLAREGKVNTLFHEWAYGAEFELLLLHKFTIRITGAGVDSSARKGSDFITFVTAAQKF